ncbi:hypothetical protein [Eoetvoesiella caeni]
MAHVVTLEVLVDESDESAVYDSLNELFRNAQAPQLGNIVDWSIKSSNDIHESLADELVNETYVEGDAFADWIIFSASELEANGDGACFWSREYGWTTFDLATRFGANQVNLPIAKGNDAVFLLANKAQL